MNHRHQPETLQGKGLSPGEGWGVAYRVEPRQPAFYRLRITPEEVSTELRRFREAVARARELYAADKQRFESLVGTDHSYIVDAHLLMLEDRELLDEIEARVSRRLDSPERALRHVADRYLAAYRSLRDDFFRERALDFEEVIGRILSYLAELAPEGQVEPTEDLILVGPEVGLSVLARFPFERIRGLVTTRGGETSHVVIIARSSGIPVVGGIDDLASRIDSGDHLFVNGTTGTVEIGVQPRDRGRDGALPVRAEPRVPTAPAAGPCHTVDDQRVLLLANTEFRHEVRASLKLGAEGIGLFRTEFICLRRGSTRVDEDEHYAVYRALAQDGGGRPIVIRTLDLSERGPQVDAGEGAALGIRGIRLSLTRPADLKAQLRAIVRARRHGDLRVVLPMVTSLDEVLTVRALLRDIERKLEIPASDSIPLGVLLEVPAAVLTLDTLAPAVDFLSVGTNDLIQYTLAAGRFNHQIAHLYNPLHPAVLRSLGRIVKIAEEQQRPVMVCGEMAANPLQLCVLIGLGYRQLSMNPLAIPAVRELVSRIRAGELENWVSRILGLGTVQEIQQFVDSSFPTIAGVQTTAGVA